MVTKVKITQLPQTTTLKSNHIIHVVEPSNILGTPGVNKTISMQNLFSTIDMPVVINPFLNYFSLNLKGSVDNYLIQSDPFTNSLGFGTINPHQKVHIKGNLKVGGSYGTGASLSAVVDISTTAITTVVVNNGGSGYNDSTTISVTGSGAGASFSVTLDPVTKAITHVGVTTGGSGYTTPVVNAVDIIQTPGIIIPAVEDISGAAGTYTLNTAYQISKLNITGSSIYQLGVGVENQTKTIIVSTIGTGGAGSISLVGVNFLGFTSLQFTHAGDSVTLYYHTIGSNGYWGVISSHGATIV
jgi:hypothetical protein